MGVIHKSQRLFGIGKIPQADYLTPNAQNDIVKLIATDSNYASYRPNTQDNRDHATGHAQPTDQWTISHETGRAFDIQASAERIGILLLLAFGSVVTTQPDAVNYPTVYKHVFSPLDVATTRQLPATTLVERVGSALNRKMPSQILQSLGFRGQGLDRIGVSGNFFGSGEYITPSGLTVPDDSISLHYFYGSQATLKLDDGTTVTNYGTTKRLNSWGFDISNELLGDQGFRPGANRFQNFGDPESGALRSECLVGNQVFSTNYNARFLAESDELAALRAQTPFKETISLIGAPITSRTVNDAVTNGTTTITSATAVFTANDSGKTVYVSGNGNKLTATFTYVSSTSGTLSTAATWSGSGNKLQINGLYSNQLDVVALKSKYQTADLGEQDGLVAVDVKSNLLYDETLAGMITATLYNTVQSYLT